MLGHNSIKAGKVNFEFKSELIGVFHVNSFSSLVSSSYILHRVSVKVKKIL